MIIQQPLTAAKIAHADLLLHMNIKRNVSLVYRDISIHKSKL